MRRGAIPSFTPLAVPEVTTWGESGGDKALCCQYNECIDIGGGGVMDYSLGDDMWFDRTAAVYDDGKVLVHVPIDDEDPATFVYEPTDIATAIRFVAGESDEPQ